MFLSSYPTLLYGDNKLKVTVEVLSNKELDLVKGQRVCFNVSRLSNQESNVRGEGKRET